VLNSSLLAKFLINKIIDSRREDWVLSKIFQAVLVEVEIFLSEQLDMKVDLVAKGGLKPTLKDLVLSEVVYV
jgi:predicted nucleotidyltransferase